MAVLALPAAAQDAPAPPKRPKIGIAFAGGGARGGAHVGVLKVLEELYGGDYPLLKLSILSTVTEPVGLRP